MELDWAMVFGIILDQFGQLRDEESENKKQMRTKCFICGLPKDDFDAHFSKRFVPNGFETVHLAQEHHMWDYLYFTIHLRETSETEFTGTDSYVMDCLKHQDLSWVPRNKALCLENGI